MIRLGFTFALLSAAVLCIPHFKSAADDRIQSNPKDRRVVTVRNVAELQQALKAAQPGTRIEMTPGDYPGGIYFEGLRGSAGQPVVIAAADPDKPPRFVGGGNGLHLVNPFFVELHDLHFTGATGNALSIDDGGKYTPEPRHLLLRRIQISDVGPRGNHDGIKLSGITSFRIEECTLERWGSGSGSGIDMVGCHDGVLSRNIFRHNADTATTGGNGIQAKGGSRDIRIRHNRFEHAGTRAINLGGSTGLKFFRPPLEQWPPEEPRYEAKNIVVEGNTLIGSLTPFAFVGIDGATVRFNTIYHPGRWALRILQENTGPDFVPSRNSRISDNVIVFRSDAWAEGGINIGAGTAPETFEFARNLWFCSDRPERSRPGLPTAESDGTYGIDPKLRDPAKLDLRLGSGSRARDKGADAAPE